MADLEVKGLRELQERLKALPGKIATKALAASVMAGADIVRKAAIEKAPIGTEPHAIRRGKGQPKVEPGFLRKNIIRRRNRKAEKAASGGLDQRVTVDVGIRGKAYYWRFVEFGTAKMAARPFLRPAFEENKEKAATAIKDRLLKRLDAIARAK